MRNPNRIPVLFDIYQRDSVKESYLKNVVGLASKPDIAKFLAKWKQYEDKLLEEWKKYPDSRMSQMLVITKILPNLSGRWFYMEDEKFLERYGIADRRQTTVWTKVDDDLEKGIPVKNISDKDLFSLRDEMGEDLPNYLVQEIEFRGSKNISVSERNNPYYQLEIDE